jgi:hypothetical protein
MFEFARCQSYPAQGIVTTTHCIGEGRTVIALRSYTCPEGARIPHHHDWTWDDAALATTAAPVFFNRHFITKDKHRYFFEDAGAHRTNNPTKFALEECRKLDPHLHATDNCLFISLGTGTRNGASDSAAPGFFSFLQAKRATANAVAKHAVNVNDVHESMEVAAAGAKSGMYVNLVAIERKIRRRTSAPDIELLDPTTA